MRHLLGSFKFISDYLPYFENWICSDSVVFWICSDSVVFWMCSDSVVILMCSDNVVFFFMCSDSVVFLMCFDSVVFWMCSDSVVFFCFSFYAYLAGPYFRLKIRLRFSLFTWHFVNNFFFHKTILTPTLFIKVPVPREESERSCTRVCYDINSLVATSADSVSSSNLVRITIAPIGTTFGNLQ